jgi:hypothetical protein
MTSQGAMPQSASRIALGIQIHQQDFFPGFGHGIGQIQGNGGLAHPAFLVRDTEDATHRLTSLSLVRLPEPIHGYRASGGF